MSGVCLICGQALPPKRKKYCSEACAREAERQLARQATAGREHPKPYHTIICPDCGREVYMPIKSKRCPDCQAEANRRHDLEAKQRKRAGKTRAIGSVDLCQRCGKPYEVESGMQKYCKACAPIAIAENDRAASRAWNQAAYADPEKRTERNTARRRPQPEAARCPICGSAFQPRSTRDVYCSAACADAAARRQMAQYEADHRQEITAKKAMQRREKLDAMTDAERRAYRAGANAQARAAYARRGGNAFDRSGLLTVTEYAQERGMKYVTVMAQIRAGRLLGAVKIDGHWYIPDSAVLAQPRPASSVCACCGKEFTQKAKGPAAAYCSAACWRKANAQRLREASAQWYQDNRERVRQKRCVKGPD